MKPPATGPSGFTFIELVIVTLIISIICVAATPSITENLSEMRIASAVSEISLALQYTQSASIKGKSHRIVFDVAGNYFYVLNCGEDIDRNGEACGDDDDVGARHPIKKAATYRMDIDDEDRLSGIHIWSVDFDAGSQVSFDRLGRPNHGGDVVVNYAKQCFEIVVSPFTGSIASQELDECPERKIDERPEGDPFV